MKRKLNWKCYILIFIIISFTLLLILTFPYISKLFEMKEWIKSIVIGSIMSIISSLIVSLIFTVQMDKRDYIDELEKEINNLFELYFKVHNDIFKIIYDITISSKIKQFRLSALYYIKPNMSALKSEYPQFNDFYKLKVKKIQKKIENLDYTNNKTLVDDFGNMFSDFEFCYMEIINELLKVQEQFYQKYKGAPKKEIKDELVFKETSCDNKKD